MARSLKKGPFVDDHVMKKSSLLKRLMIINQLKLGQEEAQLLLI